MFRIATLGLFTALASTSSAQVVIFENTNPSLSFLLPANEGSETFGHSLNITLDAFSQQAVGSAPSTNSIYFSFLGGATSFTGDTLTLRTGSSASLSRSSVPTEYVGGEDGFPPVVFDVFGPRHYENGDAVEPGADWAVNLPAWYRHPYGTRTTLTDEFIMGVRVTIAGEFHYGFVEMERSGTTFGGLLPAYRPVRWGYEATPNTPIVIPAPAPLALLAGVGLFATRRRR